MSPYPGSHFDRAQQGPISVVALLGIPVGDELIWRVASYALLRVRGSEVAAGWKAQAIVKQFALRQRFVLLGKRFPAEGNYFASLRPRIPLALSWWIREEDHDAPAGRSKSPGYGHLKLPHLMIVDSAAEQR